MRVPAFQKSFTAECRRLAFCDRVAWKCRNVRFKLDRLTVNTIDKHPREKFALKGA